MSRHRPSTTPMDFEWDNETGRIDSSSPWITSQQSHFAKKRKLNSFASDPTPNNPAQPLTRSLPEGPSGTHSVLDSPTKNPFSTPNRPQLREPNGQHYLFSGQRPIPSIPSHVQNSSAWEPRTPQSVVDFSSGGETPNTPAQDSDIATPDTQLASRMDSLSHGDKKSPRKSRGSFMGLFSRSSPSPSKEPSSRKGYSKKAENRVLKRRSRKQKNATVEDYDDSETEQGRTKKTTAGGPKPTSSGVFTSAITNIPGVLHWVEAHPNLPTVLSYYMQFLVNTILGLSFLYIFYSVLCAVINDVSIEANSRATVIMHEIAVCVKHYRDNGCDLARIPPALQQPCMQWESCMNQDVKKIAHASVGMTAIAKIINAFTEEFSYKSMIFMAIVLFGGFNLSNWAFNRIRHDQGYHHPSSQPQYDYAPPATPQRQISGGAPGYMMNDGGQPAWHTPYGTPYASIQRPALQHASQSLPALPSSSTTIPGDTGAGAAEDQSERVASSTIRAKRGIFRR